MLSEVWEKEEYYLYHLGSGSSDFLWEWSVAVFQSDWIFFVAEDPDV